MHCPKCRGVMRTYTRSGVHIEQCDSCRGIFLDYGELEQIVSAEQQFNSSPPPLEYDAPSPGAPPAGPAAPAPPAGFGYRPDSPSPYRGRPDSPAPFRGGFGGYRDSPRPYGRKRRKSIFDQLFD